MDGRDDAGDGSGPDDVGYVKDRESFDRNSNTII